MSKAISVKNLRELDACIATNTFVIIDFWAAWCPPCRMIGPVFEQLSVTHTNPGSLLFVKVDVDAAQDVAQRYGVMAMPTFILLQNGYQVSQVKGANPPGIRTLVIHAIQTIQAAQATEGKVEEEQSAVSGSYTVSSNPSWRMAL